MDIWNHKLRTEEVGKKQKQRTKQNKQKTGKEIEHFFYLKKSR